VQRSPLLCERHLTSSWCASLARRDNRSWRWARLPAEACTSSKGTQATAVGVTVTVKADAWSGQPAELIEVIPLLVTIENNSRVPVRLRYAEFTLAGDGERGSALPRFEITGTDTEPVGTTGLIDGPYPFPLRGF
jgi:hypothetical protein